MSEHQGRDQAVGVGMFIVVAFLFAFNGSFSKAIIEAGLLPVRLTEIRSLGSAAVLFVVLLGVRLLRPATASAPRATGLHIRWAEVPFLALYGIVGFAITQVLYFTTLSMLPVGVTTLLIYLAPVVVALWLRFGRRQPSSRLIWLALGLVLLGLSFVAQFWSGMTLNAVGILAGVATAISLACYWLLGEAGSRQRDAVSLTFWGFVFATLVWSVLAPWWTFPWSTLGATADFLDGRVPDVPVWALVAWLVVLGTVVPFLLVVGSVRRIGSQRAGIIGTTEPVWATVLAFLLLGETITGVQAVGGLVVLAGIIVAELSARRVPPPVGP